MLGVRFGPRQVVPEPWRAAQSRALLEELSMESVQCVLLLIIAAAAFWLGASRADGAGPSFDCRRASTIVEHEICRKDQLATFDRHIAALYTQALGLITAADADALRTDQRLWLKFPDDCGY